jgi:hypothetical protein
LEIRFSPLTIPFSPLTIPCRRLTIPFSSLTGGFLVLVIDDESDSRVILKRSFENPGCSVVTAARVDERLALARSVSPGMITVDLMMPHKNGCDMLRELQTEPVLRSIPIIVVGAWRARIGRSCSARWTRSTSPSRDQSCPSASPYDPAGDPRP